MKLPGRFDCSFPSIKRQSIDPLRPVSLQVKVKGLLRHAMHNLLAQFDEPISKSIEKRSVMPYTTTISSIFGGHGQSWNDNLQS